VKHRLQTLTRAVSPTVNRVTTFLYDDADRVQTTQLPAEAGGPVPEIGFTYTPDGYVESITPPYDQPPARVHGFEYSPVHLERFYRPPDVAGVSNPDTEYVYSPDRQLDDVLRPDGKVVDFTWNPTTARLDSVATKQGGVTLTSTSYGYNAAGLPETLATADGGTLTYGYKGAFRTSATWGPVASGRVSGTVGLEYDNSFRLNSVSVNGVALAVGYDNDDVVTSAGDLSLSSVSA
jgi:hypothetical protein